MTQKLLHRFSCIYLAGPMRSKPDLNREAFKAACDDLSGMGYINVHNPASDESIASIGQMHDKEIAAHCAKMVIEWADAIVVLPEWKQSKGAIAEVAMAHFAKKMILDYPDLTPIAVEIHGTPTPAWDKTAGDKCMDILRAVARKEHPVFSGVLKYFPDAIMEIANVSFVGNEQHHPGTVLHWDRAKSTDEADALVRHLMEAGKRDSDGMRHTAKVAWRALALLQKEIEEEENAPIAAPPYFSDAQVAEFEDTDGECF